MPDPRALPPRSGRHLGCAIAELSPLLVALAEAGSHAVAVFDAQRHCRFANAAFAALLGRPPAEPLRSHRPWGAVGPRQRVIADVDRVLSGVPATVGVELSGADGRDWEVGYNPVCCTPGSEVCGVGILALDVTTRSRALRELSHRATHDPLTGLLNRGELVNRLAAALVSARRAPEQWVAVAYADVDRFKAINDSYGHGAGDLVLVSIAKRLRDCLREGDPVGRLGGDEFGWVCAGMGGRDGITNGIDRVRAAVAAPMEVVLDGAAFMAGVTLSVGMVIADPGETAAEALRRADLALYAAKP